MTKSTISILALTIFMFSTTGCSEVIPEGKAETQNPSLKLNNLEAIYGFEANTDTLKFVVLSTGCTKEKHFSMAITNIEREGYTVTLTRNKRDRCKAMPKMISVQLPLESPLENTARLKVNNPFAVSRSGN